MTFRGDANFDTSAVSQGGGGGGIGGGAIAVGGGGIVTVILVIVSMIFGVDLTGLAPGAPIQPEQQQSQGSEVTGCTGEEANDPANVVCRMEGGADSMSRFWTATMQANDLEYADPSVQLFDRQVSTGCGSATSAVGPFYCPPDQKVYIDLAFYRELRERFRAPGDFAQAYVIAHEVGHHVQNQLGIMQKLQSLQGRVSRQEFNQASVRVELQADCFAGVWAHHAGNANLLDPGDVEEGLTAASAIGDDRIQKQTKGMVVPESFTHGSSAQRVRWFKRGMQTGRMQDCDTFNTRVL